MDDYDDTNNVIIHKTQDEIKNSDVYKKYKDAYILHNNKIYYVGVDTYQGPSVFVVDILTRQFASAHSNIRSSFCGNDQDYTKEPYRTIVKLARSIQEEFVKGLFGRPEIIAT